MKLYEYKLHLNMENDDFYIERKEWDVIKQVRNMYICHTCNSQNIYEIYENEINKYCRDYCVLTEDDFDMVKGFLTMYVENLVKEREASLDLAKRNLVKAQDFLSAISNTNKSYSVKEWQKELNERDER